MATTLVWDQVGQKIYETGVSNGVLFVADSAAPGGYADGVAWNGLVNVTESPSGAEATAIYADNIKYLSLMSAEEFGCSIEAYTYPTEFEACDGSVELGVGVTIGQQPRKKFALVYKTLVGNDVDGQAHGYKLHIVYNCSAAPSERAYGTVNDSPEAITFSWEITTDPVPVDGHNPTSLITIDSTKIDTAKLTAIEAKLFGDGTDPATMMSPAEIVTALA